LAEAKTDRLSDHIDTIHTKSMRGLATMVMIVNASVLRKNIEASLRDNWIRYHRSPTMFPAKSKTILRRSVPSSGNRRKTKRR